MAKFSEYVKRDVSRAGSRVAGDVLNSFLGEVGIGALASKVAEKAGGAVREGAEAAAGKLGASAALASKVGRVAPLGLTVATAAVPLIIDKLGQGGPSSTAEEIAVRQAGAMGTIDQKLQADLVRQEGYMRMNEQKFQQQLMLQQARADAMTPRNQPMSGAGLFDPLAVGQQIYGRTPQY
tara:strand:+ start:407 stop:946 length:540 start_codon:yes stop_codon:yes gene_type:complete